VNFIGAELFLVFIWDSDILSKDSLDRDIFLISGERYGADHVISNTQKLEI
jgi:hypothetical protein